MTILVECRTHGLGNHPIIFDQQYAHARTVANRELRAIRPAY
jgi:hypothetical protein